jgi:spoIIIJ-associated protein
MKQVEKHGKTVEEAREAALKELGVTSDEDVDIEVLDEGSKGMFGWGTKFARVRATLKKEDVELLAPETAEPSEPARVPPPMPTRPSAPQASAPAGRYAPTADIEEVIGKLLELMGLPGKVEKTHQDERQIRFNIVGGSLGILIGKHGQTLEALQFIVNLIYSKRTDDRSRITVDVEGYRDRREKGLEELAVRMADKAKREGKSVILKPMMPNERRIIHMALQNDPHVSTYSQGEEPLRKVVISPKRAPAGRSGEVSTY